MQANSKKVIDTLVGLIANAAHTDDALAASAAIENVLMLDAKESEPVASVVSPVRVESSIQATGA